MPVKITSPLPTLINYASRQDWAMHLPILQQTADIVERHCAGIRLSADEINNITAEKRARGTDSRSCQITRDGRAIIPVSGIIAKHANMVNGMSQPQGTSIEKLNAQLDDAMSDDQVRSIFLHIESPGGVIDGLADFASDIYQAGFDKPVVAFADDLCASAAYWLASQANVIYANQTADVGSIGVYTLYVDSSQRAAAEGLKFHIFRSGANKGVGEPGIVITDENRDVIQERINSKFEIFLSAILRSRSEMGLVEEDLRALADGRCYVGAEAVKLGLVDGIMSLQQALSAELPEPRSKENIVTAGTSAAQIDENFNKETEMTKTNESASAAETKTSDAVAAERQRITALNSILVGDGLAQLRGKAIAEGLSLTEAKALAFDESNKLHAEEKTEMQKTLNEANSRLKAIAEGGSEVEAELPDDRDESTASGDDAQAETYEKAVAGFVSAGETQAQAYGLAAKKYPKAHEAWKALQ